MHEIKFIFEQISIYFLSNSITRDIISCIQVKHSCDANPEAGWWWDERMNDRPWRTLPALIKKYVDDPSSHSSTGTCCNSLELNVFLYVFFFHFKKSYT